ncbi:MAG: hypothetical protein KGS72_10645 [Cyanobacteria bacterium REEB67]|nr:hypothetical protein [Cyanobacteria bacterium REEB67]
MSYIRLSILIATLLYSSLGYALAAEPDHAQQSQIEGWLLHQQNRTDGGLDVSVSKNNLRIFIPKNGLTLLAGAPWKEVAIYCTKTKNIYRTSASEFRNPYLRAMSLFDGHTKTEVPIVFKENCEDLAMPCKTYTARPGFDREQMLRRKNQLVNAGAPVEITYITTGSLHCDPHVGRLMSRFYAIPEMDDVPLQFRYVDTSQKKSVELSTATCKKSKFKSSEFDIPSGLKPVKDAMAVLVPDNRNGELDLMMMGQTRVK